MAEGTFITISASVLSKVMLLNFGTPTCPLHLGGGGVSNIGVAPIRNKLYFDDIGLTCDFCVFDGLLTRLNMHRTSQRANQRSKGIFTIFMQ
jgi:hypothetical protein